MDYIGLKMFSLYTLEHRGIGISGDCLTDSIDTVVDPVGCDPSKCDESPLFIDLFVLWAPSSIELILHPSLLTTDQ